MKKIWLILVFSLVFTPAAIGASYITGAGILNNSVQKEDLGDDVTRVKIVEAVIVPSDDNWTCPDPDNDETCHPIEGSGGGIQRVTISCESGNLTSAGFEPADIMQGFNLDVISSYTLNDKAWQIAFYNTGPDPIPLKVRAICI